MPPAPRTPNSTSTTPSPTPTPSTTETLEEDRPSPLPVFNNPAYESSTDDLEENETASSTVSNNNSVKSRDELNSSCRNHQNNKTKTTGNSNCTDPLEDLRNLAREIGPGITLTKANVDHILKIASNMNDNYGHTNPEFQSNEDENIKRRNSLTTDNNLKNTSSELCLKMDVKQLSARKGKPISSSTDVADLYCNNLEADLKRMTKDYKKAKAAKEAAAKKSGSLETKFFGFTLKQCTLFVLFAVANILSGITISLQAPFYPEVALEKGATYTENGIVFSCFELTVFIMAPLFGKNMNRIGPKVVFNLGIILTAVCSSLFGFLIYVDSRYIFIGLSIIIRVFEAVGAAGHVTASFTLIAVVFPENISTVFAMMETCTGIGLIVGPVVGGALHQLGGFTLPFIAIGGLLFICVIFGYFLLIKQSDASFIKETDPNEKQYGYADILKIPVVALSGFSILTAATSIGYNAPVLERHISIFDLTKVETGLVFIINGGTYAITAPFWGRLCDKLKRPRFLTLLGAMFILIGFLFIGPVFFIPFDTILWVTCVGLFIQGLGLGANFVSGFALALHDSIAAGLPDGIGTYGLVSGLWMSAFSLGNFIGPFLSGILQDNVGYRVGSVSVIGVQIMVVIISLGFLLRSDNKDPKSNKNKDSELEIHAENGIAVREAKFFTNGFD